MNCEEFEIVGIDTDRDLGLTAAQREAAEEHAWNCPRCAALQESWAAASAELRTFAASTQTANTPERVEMRLRREFRTLHHTMKTKRIAAVTSWALAGAAMLVGAISWYNWHRSLLSAVSPHSDVRSSASSTKPAGGNESQTLLASHDSGFTQLPGALLTDVEDTSVVRVRMPRGALGSLGLPVSEETASDWIQVDLLVTDDGQPQAIRLLQ
jgi:hypothetical protein